MGRRESVRNESEVKKSVWVESGEFDIMGRLCKEARECGEDELKRREFVMGR